MRSVKLDRIRLSDKGSIHKYRKQHCVTLAADKQYYFGNIHQARTFLAITNRFLNMKLMEINRIHIALWSEYRIIYVEHNKMFLHGDMESQFAIIEKSINSIIRFPQTDNKNCFVYIWFEKCIELLSELCFKIIEKLQVPGRGYLRNEFMILNQRLEFIELQLKNWGHEYMINNPPIFYKLKTTN